MRTTQETIKKTDYKIQNSAATKISKIVDDFLIPMVSSPIVKKVTTFESIHARDISFIDAIAVQHPSVVACKSEFLIFINKLYDDWYACKQ